MHAFDESTNIAANLHCLWLIFHLGRIKLLSGSVKCCSA